MKKTPLLALSALFLLTLPSSVRGDELIRFKSGYEMMVASHREDTKTGMIVVTLPDGGEVGFKKELLDLLEGDKATTRTGPSPLWNRVPRRFNNKRAEAPPPEELPSRFLARGSTAYNGQTVGYNYHDQKFERFSGGPIGEVNANGRIGIDVRDRSRIMSSPSESKTQKGQKAVTPSLQADIPTKGE